VARHSRAARALVRIAVEGKELRLEVSDDGIGLATPVRGGFGLDCIGERVKLLGGTVTLGGRREAGTALAVRLPLGARLG
jgi:signal transduction histidine kinase